MRVKRGDRRLEVLAVRPIPMVSTRIIAALTAIIPLYLISLFSSYIATKTGGRRGSRPGGRNLRPLFLVVTTATTSSTH